MTRVSTLAFLLTLGLAGSAQASQVSATANASVVVTRGGGVAVLTPLIMPSIVVSDAGAAAFSSNTPAVGGSASGVASKARLTLLGDSSDTVSVDVPASFAVVRAGGGETLTVNTTTNSDLAVAGAGVLLGGGIIGNSATSVDIGGKLALASADHLVPGPYDGLLVVVVQYN